MNWKRFNIANNVAGLLVSLVATITYLMTIGPTASLWDCAEFIACAYRLEAGHPPGAPFFMLVYNVATQLAPSVADVALYANAMSAIISGLCILFLYWTITHMMRRVIAPQFTLEQAERSGTQLELPLSQAVAILGSAVVGSLIYTFSDTFWFSAVEAEVYAFSSLFTAVVFWLIFKWEERSHQEGSDRWLILIGYLMGLSIGVHLLNLLCLPAMALVYYYKRCGGRATLRGSAIAVGVAFVLIAVMMFGLVQGLPKMAGRFDYVFVNIFGLGFNSGLYAYVFIVLCLLIWSVWEGHRLLSSGAQSLDRRAAMALFCTVVLMGVPFVGSGVVLGLVLSLALGAGLYLYAQRIPARHAYIVQMSLFAFFVGFCSYGVILIRAEADTPMNENAPGNAFSLRYYLAREQYGSTPLLYGPTFASRRIGSEVDQEVMGKAPKDSPTDADRYTKLYDQPKVKYEEGSQMLFPRVYDSSKAASYNVWMGRKPSDMTQPTMMENLTYFFRYQVNYMYWRYFMWNFAGRQNDLPGDGSLLRGNAITGIPVVDEVFIGPVDDMPTELADNKGRNVYYALPLLLGLLGMFYQITRQRRDEAKDKSLGTATQSKGMSIGVQSFWITFLLFFMTGLAIVLYLNQHPAQPRERDYAYAGSFYAFAIWTAFGVLALWRALSRLRLSELASAGLASVLALAVPLQMASENWDDHDRSGNTLARDMGINYLESCEPNAILFCYGDNDTFPLWYMQDVEGLRTDVRTVNLSYLAGDWYIDQMRRRTYEGAPLPMKYMKPSFYYYHEVAYLDTRDEAPALYLDDALRLTVESTRESEVPIFPTTRVFVPADTAYYRQYLAQQDPHLAQRVAPVFALSFQGQRYLDRGSLTVLDMLQASGGKRPMYWTITSPRSTFSNIANLQVQTGTAYQLLPLDLSPRDAEGADAQGEATQQSVPAVRIEQMYRNVMEKFRYGGADNPSVYMDEAARNILLGMRSNVFGTLASALLDMGDKDRAQKVLRRSLEAIRAEVVPYDYYSLTYMRTLYRAEMSKEADVIAKTVVEDALRKLRWMMRLPERNLLRLYNDGELDQTLEIATLAYRIADEYGSKVCEPYTQELVAFMKTFSPNATPSPKASPEPAQGQSGADSADQEATPA